MDLFVIFLEILIVAVFIYWSLHLVGSILLLKKVPKVKDLPAEHLNEWPRVSVILTARNEKLHLEQAMKKRLRDNYPNLEYVLVEDRSTDGTDIIADELASEDNRIKVLHIEHLPDGWLGKLNAMNEGLKVATGEWILFSDADMFIDETVLSSVIAYSEKNSIDHLCIFPEFLADTLSLKVLFSGLTRILALGGKLWAVANPKSKSAVGVGGFNLVKRSSFEKTGGLEWIKMDVADDVALGTMMKRAGFSSVVLSGKETVKVYLYKTWAASIQGTEKAAFTTIGSFSPLIMIALAAGLILEMSPFYAFAFGISKPFLILSLMAIAISTLSSLLIEKWLCGRFLSALFWPFGLALVMALSLNGFFNGWRKGGINWRDTFYPTKTLKEGKRFYIFSNGKF